MVTDLLVLAKDLKKDKALKIIPSDISRLEKVHVVNAVNKLKKSSDHQYIFLTPDSIFEDNYVYNLDVQNEKLKELNEKLNEQKEIAKTFEFNIRYDSTWKNFENKAAFSGKYKVKVGNNYCQVEFTNINIPELQVPEMENINSVIKEATDNIRFKTFHIPRVEKVQNGVVVSYMNDDDSMRSYQYNFKEIYIDSLMRWNRRMIDSLMRSERMRNPMFDDSVLSRWFFDQREFNTEALKEQMKEIQEEFKRFREEMNSWRNEAKSQKQVSESDKQKQ